MNKCRNYSYNPWNRSIKFEIVRGGYLTNFVRHVVYQVLRTTETLVTYWIRTSMYRYFIPHIYMLQLTKHKCDAYIYIGSRTCSCTLPWLSSSEGRSSVCYVISCNYQISPDSHRSYQSPNASTESGRSFLQKRLLIKIYYTFGNAIISNITLSIWRYLTCITDVEIISS